MKWDVKHDRGYWYMIFWVIIVCMVPLSLPLWLDDTLSFTDRIILISIIVAFDLFMLWVALDIRYEFRNESFYAKCGPFRSNIPYKNITKVNETDDMLFGFRLAASLRGIEIHYPKGMLGSVKISPKDEKAFIEALLSKCPHLARNEYINK
ncbi:PH domain-containing protein [Bacillus manliponensis]|uniref:PH domain-containing protein n=1 Tax=Bacillus manliponensis TaxID=574376 RepID=UPI003511EBCC